MGVLFGIKDEATPQQMEDMKQCLVGMQSKIGAIKASEYGVDLKLPSGQTHPAGKNRSVKYSADFVDEAGYDVYAQHPAHLECIKDAIAPILQPGSRAAI